MRCLRSRESGCAGISAPVSLGGELLRRFEAPLRPLGRCAPAVDRIFRHEVSGSLAVAVERSRTSVHLLLGWFRDGCPTLIMLLRRSTSYQANSGICRRGCVAASKLRFRSKPIPLPRWRQRHTRPRKGVGACSPKRAFTNLYGPTNAARQSPGWGWYHRSAESTTGLRRVTPANLGSGTGGPNTVKAVYPAHAPRNFPARNGEPRGLDPVDRVGRSARKSRRRRQQR